ncbi:MAG: LruC domain-containing protein [Bacteroidales bacterium]|nr:LruC domain-containing protein [Bacteroidales bacterium]
MKAAGIFLIIAILLCINGCKKPTIEDSITQQKTTEQILTSDNFDWKMSRTVEFNISSNKNEEIRIMSVDRQVIFHKGKHDGKGNYSAKVGIPYTYQQVYVNDQLVDIGNKSVNINLATNKAVQLTNYCLLFDGVDDYVNLGDITQLNNASTFTIEGWANQTTNTDNERIFHKYSDGDNDISIAPYGGSFIIEIGNGSNSYGEWAAYSATVTSGTWFHWAVVYDGSGVTDADKLKLYINGNTTPIVLAFTGTIPATTSAALASDDATLSPSSADFFGGYMDEVRVWSDVRTPTEINTNYNKVISTSSTGLVAYYRMDEGTGTSIEDLTSNTYNGTINGCSWALYVNAWDSDGDGVTDLNDDYEMDATRAYDNFYPAADTGTVVFEDLWPGIGDYDFNDLVMGYRFKTVTNASNDVVEIFAYFFLRANGAVLENGFGFELPDAVGGLMTDLVVSGYTHADGYITINGTTKLESGQTNPVIIVNDNVSNSMDGYSNTEQWRPYVSPVALTITMTPSGGPYTAGDFSISTWSPFLIIDKTRGSELHLLDYVPTDLMNTALFGIYSDASVPATNDYYKTSTNLPWALDFPVWYNYPIEKADISTAYLHFVEWAESSGASYTDWYTNTGAGYRNTSKIYQTP